MRELKEREVQQDQVVPQEPKESQELKELIELLDQQVLQELLD